MSLMGKTAIITGASRGIGRAIALALAESGANIAINYARNERAALEVLEEAKKIGVKAIALKADVSKSEEVKNFNNIVFKEFKGIDILVNNAGINKDNLLIRMPEVEFDQVISINLKGVFNFTKHVSKIMIKQRKGKIINISSVVGISGNAGQSNYAASKSAVIGFTKSIAKELASRNINVNAVAPGYIETDMTAAIPEKIRENMKELIPLRKPGKAKDVANAVVFLAGENSDYITGQVINIDGGMVM